MLQRISGVDPNAASAGLHLYGGSIGGAIRFLKLLLVLSVVGPAVVLAGAGWLGWRDTYTVLAAVLAVTVVLHAWGLRAPWPTTNTPRSSAAACARR